MSPVVRWALFLFLLTGFCGSCAHKLQKHQASHRTEDDTVKWDKRAESAVEKQRNEETKKQETGRKVTRKFRPDGTLDQEILEEMVAVTDTRGLETVRASASASTSGSASRSVDHSSSSSTKSETKAGVHWLVYAIPTAVVTGLIVFFAWRVYRRVRIP